MESAIRAAGPEDANAIADAHVASWRAAYVGKVPQHYLDQLSPGRRAQRWSELLSSRPPMVVFVAETTDAVLGFASVGPSRDTDDDVSGPVGEVMAIYTRPEAWGHGVGRRLMERAVRHLTATGFAEATLPWVLDSNDRAIRFYEAGGWVADGAVKQRELGGLPVTEVRFRRSLQPA
jgi:GNAT superfamily N-acetyltransferase